MNSDNPKIVAHEGVVVNYIDDKAIVYLLHSQSCDGCRMKDFCGIDNDRSRFEVPKSQLEIGDHVSLEINSKAGFLATFWAYLLPFLLILAVLVGGSAMNISEAWLGIASLTLLIPYFLILSAFKAHLGNRVKLTVVKK